MAPMLPRAALLPLFAAVLLTGCSKDPEPTVNDEPEGPKSVSGSIPGATGDPLPDHLAKVPTDAAVVVHVRFADLWAHPAVATFRDGLADEPDEIQKTARAAFGLSPADVDTITVYWPSITGPNDAENFGVVVTTTKPVDQDAVRQAIARSSSGGDGPMPLPPGVTPVFDGDRVIRLMNAKVSAAYGATEPNGGGPLRTALELAAAGERTLVLGVNPAGLPLAQLGGAVPPQLQPFMKAKAAFATLDMDGNTLGLKVRFDAANSEDAGKIKQAMQGLIALGRLGLSTGRADLAKEKDEESRRLGGAALDVADKVLADATVTAEGGAASLALEAELPQGWEGMMVSAVRKVRDAAGRMKSSNNLKQMTLAMHNYESAHALLPGPAITDKDGKPLLSWRVAILPYIEQENLYRQFKLDEPWDSEHNKTLIPMMPQIYTIEGTAPGEGKTFYRVFSGNPAAESGMTLSTAFPMSGGMKFTSFKDGTSNTVMVAESAEAVVWTKPEPMMCEPGQPLPKLGGHFPGGANVGFADGSVRFVELPITEETLRAMISANGGEVYSLDD